MFSQEPTLPTCIQLPPQLLTCPCHSATLTSTMLSGSCSSDTRIWFS